MSVKVSSNNNGFYSFNGIASGDNKYLDFGSLILIVSLFSFIVTHICEVILEAFQIGKTTLEIVEIRKVNNKLKSLRVLATLLIVIGFIIYMYSKLVTP